MTTLAERAAELRAAAHRFQESAAAIRTIVEQTTHLMDEANAATNSPASDSTFTRFSSQRGWVDDWAESLRRFAANLDQAADQVEASAENEPQHAAHEHHSAPQEIAPAPVKAPLPRHDPDPLRPSTAEWTDRPGVRVRTPGLEDYLSSYNRSRYETLVRAENLLPEREAALDRIAEERTELALNARMLAEHADSPGAAVELARTSARLRDLDALYYDLQDEVETMRADIETITTRLHLLTPDASANLGLIRSMENGQSPIWLRENTYDCVRYVVSRVNVPPAIARDAYLWDNTAEELQRYGIQVGNIPMPGSILVMEREHPYADDVFGHVMLVERVDADGVWVTDNHHPDVPVLLRDLTPETKLHVKYLYLPWHTRA